MFSYLTRRVVYGALVLLGVNLATFFLFFTVNTPDDMARLNIGGKRVTQELIVKWKAERGYDKPLYWNEAKQGSDKLTQTIFWERSVSLFTLNFGRADGESAGNIGTELSTRMWVSIQLALPLFIMQVLASTAFALLPIGLSLLARLGAEARLYRAMFLEEIGRDYVRTARAKGLRDTVVLYRHVLRNALIPIVT